MSSKQQQFPSEAHLLELVRGRKFKEYSAYIKAIENVNQQAQESVKHVLNNLLVKKTDKTPAVMFNALMLYKALVIGASIDYYTNDEYFPTAIHEEVGRICTYKPHIENFTTRGSDYFVDMFKIAKTEQNKEQLEKVGNSYVLLALELIRSLAKLYPLDYVDNQKSIFKKLYDGLVAKKITFPKDQIIFKSADQEAFKANFKKIMEKINEEEESPKKAQEKPKKEVPKETVVKSEVKESKVAEPKKEVKNDVPQPVVGSNTMNIAPAPLNASANQKEKDELFVIASQLTSAVVPPPKQTGKATKQDLSMIKLGAESILKTNDQPGSRNSSTTLNIQQSKAEKPAEVKVPIERIVVAEPVLQQTSSFGERQRFSDSSDSVGELKNTNHQNNNQNNSLNSKFAAKPTESINKGRESFQQPPKLEDSKIKPKVQEPPKSIVHKNQVPAKPAPTQRRQTKPKQPERQVVNIQPSSRKHEVPINNQSPKRQADIIVRQQIITSSKKQEYRPIYNQFSEPMFSFNNKQQPIEPTKRDQTPRKIAKTEKSGFNSINASPQKNINLPANPQLGNPLTKRPRSMPKTQKRVNITTAVNFYPPSKLDTLQGFTQHKKPSQQFNKTLSYWANNRIKHQPSRQLQRASNLNAILQDMRLDSRTLPYISQYYQPITPSMHALRHESLNLHNSGQSSHQFYSNKTIQCRLIKEELNVFNLTIHNTSLEALTVAYAEMKGIRYSNRIKIVSWGNQPNIEDYQIPRKGFMDIKFKFQIGDLNFKFLTFCIKINERLESIVLPITLLDMCEITPINTNNLHRYSLKGSIIRSEPFSLGDRNLPTFLGGFKFPALQLSRNKRQLQQIIGECSLRLQRQSNDQDFQSQLQVMVKVVNWQQRLLELNILYITKSQNSEDLAKIMLYLLIFLLKNQ